MCASHRSLSSFSNSANCFSSSSFFNSELVTLSEKYIYHLNILLAISLNHVYKLIKVEAGSSSRRIGSSSSSSA